MSLIERDLGFALCAVKAASAIVLHYNSENVYSYAKGDGSRVTIADLNASRVLYTILRESGYGYFDEEYFPLTRKDDRLDPRFEYVWLVDPLDGTKKFGTGSNEFGVMVALLKREENFLRPIIGVGAAPADSEIFYASEGNGAYKVDRNGETSEMHVSGSEDPLFLVSLNILEEGKDKELEQIIHELGKLQNFKYGAKNGVVHKAMCGVAYGSATGFITSRQKGMCKWDAAAAEIIVREAGGRVSDLYGEPLNYSSKSIHNETGVLMTNGIIHDKVLEKINSLF